MAKKKISQLVAVSSLDGNEPIPLVQGGVTKKATINQIVSFIGGAFINGSGTAGKLSKFVDGDTIGNSIVSESGIVVSVAGNLSISSGAPYIEIIDTSNNATHYIGGNDAGLALYADINNIATGSTIDFLIDGSTTRMSLSATELITFGATDTGEAHIFGGSARVNGVLGVGVTASAWGAGYQALQVSNTSLFGSASLDLNLGSNMYLDNVGYKYISNGFASLYNQYQGKHFWSTTTSGTAGNAITFNQVMTLEANGNLGIGTTSPASILEISQATPIFRIQATDTGSFHGIEFRQGAGFDAFIKQLPSTGEFRISNGRNVGWGGTTTFYTDTLERMRITSSGNVLIGTTTDAGYKLDVNGTINSGSTISGGLFNFRSDNTIGNSATIGRFSTLTGGGMDFELAFTRSANGAGAYYAIQSVEQGVAFRNIILNQSGGSVGIGSTSVVSTHKLSVNGKIGGITFSDSYIEFSAGGHALIKANNDVILGYNENVLVKQNGNVLVGTTTDSGNKIQVNGSSRFNDTMFFGATTQGVISWGAGDFQMRAYNSNDVGFYNTAGTLLAEFRNDGSSHFMGDAVIALSITTGDPTTGTAMPWKLGDVIASGGQSLDTGRYVEVEIDGTFYKLALLN